MAIIRGFLEGISIGGYRSFGSTIQRIGPFGKVNLFIGLNNSGKSNVLLAIRAILPSALNNSLALDANLDMHLTKNVPLVVGFGRHVLRKEFGNLIDRCGTPDEQQAIKAIGDYLSHGTQLHWFEKKSRKPNGGELQDYLNTVQELSELTSTNIWQRLRNRFRPNTSGGGIADWIQPVLSEFGEYQLFLAPIANVPAVRRIATVDSTADDFSGLNLVQSLAKLQHPDHRQYSDKKKFEAIQDFLREVTGDQKAELEIPVAQDVIYVTMSGNLLPLDSLGTGIHEVIILAAAATVLTDQIICMEEPELHLHPTLQRKLLRYLAEKTTNQYFITTHSAHLIDAELSTVFHVQLKDGETIVRLTETPSDHWRICRDLGYHASDIMQANCIIWVEGPSDRTYLQHWISIVDPDLTDGIHYSIMFYGGRLLSHLSPSDEEVGEFIRLLRLNRNLAIVMDSDKRGPKSGINQTKTRVSESAGEDAVVWLTEGREIENYIQPLALNKAIVLTDKNSKVPKRGQFLRVYPKDMDKVKLARNVVSELPGLDILDLKERIAEIVDLIHSSNPR